MKILQYILVCMLFAAFSCRDSNLRDISPLPDGSTVKSPFFISAPSVICSGSSATFAIHNAPASYTWGNSSNLTFSSASDNEAAFIADGTGSAWVSIRVNGKEVARKTVYAGTLQMADFTVNYAPDPGRSGVFSGNASSSYSVDEYEWHTDPGWTVVSHPDFPPSIPMANVRITRTSPSAPTTTPVYVRARNACGWGPGKQVATLSSPYTM
jgi:hypothetical protein